MSFDRRDIHKAMDVYTFDNIYVGTVLRIASGAARPHEDLVPVTARQSSQVNGELLGPMPTQPIGNRAPTVQSAHAAYATTQDAEPLGAGIMVVGRWWGLIGRRTIPLQNVQTVSQERVVLKQREDE